VCEEKYVHTRRRRRCRCNGFHILIMASRTERHIYVHAFGFLLLFYCPGNRPFAFIYILVCRRRPRKPYLWLSWSNLYFFHLSRISPFSTERVTNINDYILWPAISNCLATRESLISVMGSQHELCPPPSHPLHRRLFLYTKSLIIRK